MYNTETEVLAWKKIPNAVYTRELGRRSSEDDNRGWNEGI